MSSKNYSSPSFLLIAQCIGCAKKIIQSGVREVVYHLAYGKDYPTEDLFKEAGVIFRQYKGIADVDHLGQIVEDTLGLDHLEI